MESKKRAISFSIFVSIGLIALLVWFQVFSDPAQGQEPEPLQISEQSSKVKQNSNPLELRCSLNGDHEFSISSDSQFQLDPTALMPSDAPVASASASGTKHWSARMLWRVISEPNQDAQQWTVAAVFRDLEVFADDEPVPEQVIAQISQPVVFQIDERCRMNALGADPDHPPAGLRHWQLLLSFVELVMPNSPYTPSETTWEAVQTDSTGRYLASYRTDRANKTPEIHRQRLSYIKTFSPNAGVQLEAHVLSSETRGTIAPEGWFSQISADEHIRVENTDGRTFAQARTQLELEAIEIDRSDPFWNAQIDLDLLTFRSLDDLAQDRGAPLRFANREPIDGLADMSLGDVLDRFGELLDGSQSMDDALNLMVQYLRLDPQNITALLDALRTERVPDELRSKLFLALELTGGIAARDALIVATGDQDLSQIDRLRAIAALQSVPEPDETVVNAITDLWHNRGREPSDESNSALFAMGSLSGSENLPEKLRNELETQLNDALRNADDPGSTVVALGAVGNSQNPSFIDEVQQYSGNKNGNIRATAWETLNRMGHPPAVSETLDGIVDESHPRAQREMAKALQTRAPEATNDEILQAIALLGAENASKTVREGVIRFLGRLADTHDIARQALINQFQLETDRDLLVLIGRYVPANEL